MDSYVVRIYRRGKGSPQNIVGLVELVDCEEEKAFTSFEELRAILNTRQGDAAGKETDESGTLKKRQGATELSP
jgi:hypothetical protein